MNQPPGFSVRGTSTPNVWIVIRNNSNINGLHQTTTSTKTWCIAPFKIRKSWTFCSLLKSAISYYSGLWKFRNLPLHLPQIYQVFQLFIFFHFQCLSRYMCGHNLTMKFPLDFHNYIELNRLSIPYLIYHSLSNSPNKLILSCTPHWPAKRKKQHHVRRGCSVKKFS